VTDIKPYGYITELLENIGVKGTKYEGIFWNSINHTMNKKESEVFVKVKLV